MALFKNSTDSAHQHLRESESDYDIFNCAVYWLHVDSALQFATGEISDYQVNSIPVGELQT